MENPGAQAAHDQHADVALVLVGERADDGAHETGDRRRDAEYDGGLARRHPDLPHVHRNERQQDGDRWNRSKRFLA